MEINITAIIMTAIICTAVVAIFWITAKMNQGEKK